jgi:hypothetical protein
LIYEQVGKLAQGEKRLRKSQESSQAKLKVWLLIISLVTIIWIVTTGCLFQNPAQPPTSTPMPEWQQVVEYADTGLITNDPCAPPCWQGISPGDPMDEVDTILRNLSVIDRSYLSIKPETASWPGGQIILDKSGKVKSIFYMLQYRLELKDLIERVGEPDGFTITLQSEVGTPISVNLFWFDEGISINAEPSDEFRQTSGGVPVKPESLVAGAGYFEPLANAEEYFLKFVGPPDRSDVPIAEYYHFNVWQGFGSSP